MRKLCLPLALAAAFACALPSFAHHAVSAEFDAAKVVTMKGTVSRVDWVNPHIFVYVDVKDDSGKITTWRLQSAPPMFFKGSGLTKEKLSRAAKPPLPRIRRKMGPTASGFC